MDDAQFATQPENSSPAQSAKPSPTQTSNTAPTSFPASCRTESPSDPLISGPRSRSLTDITRVSVVHCRHEVLFQVTVADPSTLWRCGMRPSGDGIDVYIDTNGDNKREREIWLPWACAGATGPGGSMSTGAAKVQRELEDGGHVFCRVPPRMDAATRTFTLRVPMRCLGSPSQIRAAAAVYSDHGGRDSGTDSTDFTGLAVAGETAMVRDPVGDASRY